EDFSADIAAGRLFWVGGDDWPEQLEKLLNDQPGLPLPQQYIRTRLLLDADADNLMARAGQAISAATIRHKAVADELASVTAPPDGKLIVLAGSGFRPWDL